jgi:hypothetical protein
MERLSYFVNNPRITASTFYEPLLKHFLTAFLGAIEPKRNLKP